MKLEDAMALIRREPISEFRVAYEYTDGRIRERSCFPSHATMPQEPALTSLEYAWQLAERFAAVAPNGYENITVVGANFRPVDPERILRPSLDKQKRIAAAAFAVMQRKESERIAAFPPGTCEQCEGAGGIGGQFSGGHEWTCDACGGTGKTPNARAEPDPTAPPN